MEQIFLKLLNVGLVAGWLIIAVLFLRVLLKKAPKWTVCLLWGLVALRLICPVSFESVLSLIPSAEPIPENITTAEAPMIQSGISALNSVVNPVISEALAPKPAESVNPMQTVVFICTILWLIGMAAMLLYMAISYLIIRRRVGEAVKADGYYLSDRIESPFILGVCRPRIYMPDAMKEEDIPYALAHEKAHLKRLDHIVKPLSFLLLTVYWFQPLLWVAYILLCRDIEFACDEKVLKLLGTEHKASYSKALLDCSITKKRITACPLAFGEVGVKERIQKVLSYKKPAFWLILVALLACIATAVFFLLDPPKENPDPDPYIQFPSEETIYWVHNPLYSHTMYHECNLTLSVPYKSAHVSCEDGAHILVTRADGTEELTNEATLSPGDTFAFSPHTMVAKSYVKYSDLTCAAAEIKLTVYDQRLQEGSPSAAFISSKETATISFVRTSQTISANDPSSVYRIDFYSNTMSLAQNEDTGEYFIYKRPVILSSSRVSWRYNIAVSAEWGTVMPLYFDTDYTELHLACTEGTLLLRRDENDFDAHEMNKAIVSQNPNDKISWSMPGSAPGNFDITFKLRRGDTVVGEGTLRFEQDVGSTEQSGTYIITVESNQFRFKGLPYGETGHGVWVSETIDALRAQCPEYFDLDTRKGLEVYVWQMAPNSYSCGLMPGTNHKKELSDLLGMRSTSIEDMKLILSSYDIEPENILVIPYQNPLSSYIGPNFIIREGENFEEKQRNYIEFLRELLDLD